MENNVKKGGKSGYTLKTITSKTSLVPSGQSITVSLTSVDNYKDLTLDLIKVTAVHYACNDSVALDQDILYYYTPSTGVLKIQMGWGVNGVVKIAFKVEVIILD